MMSQEVVTVTLLYHGKSPCIAKGLPTVTPARLKPSQASGTELEPVCHHCVTAGDRRRNTVRPGDALSFDILTRSRDVVEGAKVYCHAIDGYLVGPFRQSKALADISAEDLRANRTIRFGYQDTVCGAADVSVAELERTGERFGPEVSFAPASAVPAGFDIHLYTPRTYETFEPRILLRNQGTQPVALGSIPCKLSAKFSWSDKTETEVEPCGWAGTFGNDDILPGKALTVTDTGDGEGGMPTPQICRWTTVAVELQLAFGAQKLNFQPLIVPMKEAKCSDSQAAHGTTLPANVVWHGPYQEAPVALGAILQTVDGAPQASDTPIAHDFGKNWHYAGIFHVGQPFQLHIYLDNLTDSPVTLDRRPNDFAVTANVFGLAIALDTPVEHRQASDAAEPQQTITIPPHTRQFIRTMQVSDFLTLPVGHYEVGVSPRTLQGDVSVANDGHEDAANIKFAIKIVP